MSETILHQYSDIKIIVPVTNNASGELIDAGNFSNIKYFITDILGCVRIKLSLGAGITVEDGKIIINIDDGMLDSSFKGLFSHQCIVWNYLVPAGVRHSHGTTRYFESIPYSRSNWLHR